MNHSTQNTDRATTRAIAARSTASWSPVTAHPARPSTSVAPVAGSTTSDGSSRVRQSTQASAGVTSSAGSQTTSDQVHPVPRADGRAGDGAAERRERGEPRCAATSV